LKELTKTKKFTGRIALFIPFFAHNKKFYNHLTKDKKLIKNKKEKKKK